MKSGTVDSRYHWVTCYRKQDAAYAAYVDARVAVAENVEYVDYAETGDVDYVETGDDYVKTGDDYVVTDDDCVETDDDDCVESGDDDYAEIGDDECAADDAAFDCEVIVNAADEKETDDAQHAFVEAMESFVGDVEDADVEGADAGDGAAEDAAAAFDDHDVAVIKKFALL